MTNTYHVLMETIFCDYETDINVRKKFFSRWKIALHHLTQLRIPNSVEFTYLAFISEDKTWELEEFRLFLEQLDQSWRSRIHLITYRHPPEGYGYENASHPDLKINPNKSSPFRDELFRRALGEKKITVKATRIIRIAIDDDDLWMPWQLEEIIKFSDIGFDAESISMIGFRNLSLPIIHDKRVDVVEFSRYMSGNKFYLAPLSLFPKLTGFSPWSIPEVFDEKSATHFSRYNINLKTTSSNLPGHMYCRWGENITSVSKVTYYRHVYNSFKVEDIDSLTEKSMENITYDKLVRLEMLNPK